MAFEYVGSCRIFVGDPTQANGAGMKDLGFLEDVTVDLGIQGAYTSNASLAGSPNAAGIYTLPSAPTVQAQARDGAIANLKALIQGAVEVTEDDATALGFGDSFGRIDPDDVVTVCILSDQERAAGSSAQQAIWLPGVMLSGVSGITFNRPQQGEIGNPYNVEISSAYREEDQDEEAIPAGLRLGFIGDPAAAGLSWSLPPVA